MITEPIKFLLVDDTPENLVALEALLRRDGLEILTARSGAEALELLLLHEVALAFLDVQMPDMDGFELAELMRGADRTKHVPIIFVTAGARDPQRAFKGYETGAVDFLYKPIEPHVLKSKAEIFFELSRQRRDLTTALRLNEMFVGILGHDLRNPLAAMMAGVQLLERDLDDPKHARTLRRMISSGQRMTDMIEQLLDLTRARLAGGLGFVRARKRLDVANLVQRTAEELRGAHPEREIRVEAGGDCVTSGDPDRLLQLFSNLIGNALQHGAPDSAVTVTVGGASDGIVVQIRNRGVIPAELLPTLFDPFRGRRRPASEARGLGLGLYISQQIAVSHGGNVSAESTPDRETTFTVRLPLRSTADHRTHPSGPPRLVLIVEDEESIRDSLGEAFQEEGYAVATAADGRAALELLRSGPPRPDVIVLDLVLPVMDGGRLYHAMQEDPQLRTIPVIVSTSNPARAPSGVIVVPKPLKLDRLLDTVTALWATDRRR